MDQRKQYGKSGETQAAAYLLRHGVQILEMNFRSRYGEIDLICYDGEYILVIEVKRRGSTSYGLPCETVNYRKQRRICHTFAYYRRCRGIDDYTSVRFDVIEIYSDQKIRWIKNAFEYIE